MEGFFASLARACGVDPHTLPREFRAGAFHRESLGVLWFCTEDVGWVSVPLDEPTALKGVVELLLHPRDEHVIGFKLIGTREGFFPLGALAALFDDPRIRALFASLPTS